MPQVCGSVTSLYLFIEYYHSGIKISINISSVCAEAKVYEAVRQCIADARLPASQGDAVPLGFTPCWGENLSPDPREMPAALFIDI